MRTERLPSSTPERLPTSSRKCPTSRAAASRRQPPAIPLQQAVLIWINDGRAQGFSEKSLSDRQGNLRRFSWWLENTAGADPSLDQVTAEAVRQFLAYCREDQSEGRFGCQHVNARRKARPSTLATYYRDLKTFVRFCIAEGLLDENPLANVKPPRVPFDQIQPLTPEQVQSLLHATDQTVCPARNRALILLLLDTGMRIGEALALSVGDVAGDGTQVSVVGKGNKRRAVFLGATARRALRAYLRRWRADAESGEPIFIAEGGTKVGQRMTPSGIRAMLHDCETIAGITGVRCSPHTLRHTFAITFLRNGGNLLQLQSLMGHSDLTTLRRYVALAEQDLATAHRQASPADRMGLR